MNIRVYNFCILKLQEDTIYHACMTIDYINTSLIRKILNRIFSVPSVPRAERVVNNNHAKILFGSIYTPPFLGVGIEFGFYEKCGFVWENLLS